jgi:hypothetical protein
MGCAVETPKQKRRRKGVPGARPYSELSEEAKARARDCWREKGWTWDEWDSEQLTDCFAETLLEEYGIEVGTYAVRLHNGNTQLRPDIGDGVRFKASLDLDEMAKKDDCIRKLLQAVEILEALNNWDYPPQWYASFNDDRARVTPEYRDARGEDEQRILDNICTGIEIELNAIYEQACERLKEIGYADIKYHDSDECVEDLLTANDYLFDEDGEFVE